MLNYNGKDYIEECLASIASSGCGFICERILIDNASTDDSWKLAEKYRFQVVHADNKHQFITGINAALRASNSERLLFTQGDVRFLEGSIQHLYNEVKRDNWAVFQPVFINHKIGIDNAGMNWVWPGYGIGKRKFKQDERVESTDIATSITFMTSRGVIDAVGYFDEAFAPAYYEDVDWALRSKRIGVGHYVVHGSRVVHRHNESFSKEYDKRGISDICRKNRRYLINKHYRGLDRISRLAVSSCLNIAKKSFDVIACGRVSPDYGHEKTV